MFVLVRKVLGCVARLWLCLLHTLCRKKQQEQVKDKKWTNNMEPEDNWEAEGWDYFSVKVVPNVEEPSPDTADGEDSGHSADQKREEDLFEDMKPVFRKPQKIHLHSKSNEQQQVNFSKFAVQDSVFRQEVVGELGAWSEDDGVEGWEDGLAPEEGNLVQDSHETLKKKKAHEREKRRKAQEALRTQQRAMNNSFHLGTRVT